MTVTLTYLVVVWLFIYIVALTGVDGAYGQILVTPTNLNVRRLFFRGVFTDTEKTTKDDHMILDMTKYKGDAISISIQFYSTSALVKYKRLSTLHTYDIVDNQVKFPLDLTSYESLELNILKYHGYIQLGDSVELNDSNEHVGKLQYINPAFDPETPRVLSFPVVILPDLKALSIPDKFRLEVRASEKDDAPGSYFFSVMIAGIPPLTGKTFMLLHSVGFIDFYYIKSKVTPCFLNGVSVEYKIHDRATLAFDISSVYANPMTPMVLECPIAWISRPFPVLDEDDTDAFFNRHIVAALSSDRMDDDDFKYFSTTTLDASFRFGDSLVCYAPDTFPKVNGQTWVESNRVGCAFQLDGMPLKTPFRHSYSLSIHGPPVDNTLFRLFIKDPNSYSGAETFVRREDPVLDQSYSEEYRTFTNIFDDHEFSPSPEGEEDGSEHTATFILLYISDLNPNGRGMYDEDDLRCFLTFTRFYEAEAADSLQHGIITNSSRDPQPTSIPWPAWSIPSNIMTKRLPYFKAVISRFTSYQPISTALSTLSILGNSAPTNASISAPPSYRFSFEITWSDGNTPETTPDIIRVLSPSLDLKFTGFIHSCRWNGDEETDIKMLSESAFEIQLPKASAKEGPNVFRCPQYHLTPAKDFGTKDRFVLRVTAANALRELESAVLITTLDDADAEADSHDWPDDKDHHNKSFVGWNALFVSIMCGSAVLLTVFVVLFIIVWKKYQRTKRNESFYRTLLASEQVGTAEFGSSLAPRLMSTMPGDEYQHLN